MLPFTPELDPGPGCAVRCPDPRSPISAAPRLRALRARPLPPERSEYNPWHRGPEGPMDAIRPSAPKAQAPAGIQESAADAPRPRSRSRPRPSAQHKKKSRSFLQLFLLLFLNRIYADLSLVSAKTFESDSAFCGSKECVILADLNVQAGMEMGASLTNDDVAGFSNLSCVHLCAKALGVGVTAVACAGRTFMMSE